MVAAMIDRLNLILPSRAAISAAAAVAKANLPSPVNALATVSLLAISVGCYWERPSLGLIVPGVIVFGCLVVGRIGANRPRK